MVLIMNPRRRRAVIAVFLPLFAFYLVYIFKLRDFMPVMTSWPTQQELAVQFHRLLRHRIWPWTAPGFHHHEKSAAEEDEDEWASYAALAGHTGQSVIFDGPQKRLMQGTGGRLPFRRHIVAVGDLHGDLPNARKVLQFAGITDQNGDWAGKVDYFVQTGDIIDRGDDTILLFVWMERLRVQSAAAGATMLSLLGNHEWMNAIGDWRYVYPGELKTFGSVAARQKMLTTGRIGRAWAQNYTVAARLPLHPSIGPPNTPYPAKQNHVQIQKDGAENQALFHEDPLSHAAVSFVHGGLSPTYSNLAPFPSKINELGQSLLEKLQNRVQPPPHPPNPYPGLPKEATPQEQELYGGDGPLWYRGWATEPDSVVCKRVDEVLQKTGTRRMVMGHTPDFRNIKSRCGGKIVIIDTGISHAYGGVLSALSIYYTLVPVGDDKDRLWREREVLTAVYPDRREILAKNERIIWGDFDHLTSKPPGVKAKP